MVDVVKGGVAPAVVVAVALSWGGARAAQLPATTERADRARVHHGSALYVKGGRETVVGPLVAIWSSGRRTPAAVSQRARSHGARNRRALFLVGIVGWSSGWRC